MNLKDRTDPALAYLALHRPMIAKDLKRNTRTGCLEYVGRRRGKIEGNPFTLVKRRGKYVPTLLRPWLYELHYGPVPAGKRVVMKCACHRCHEPSHMMLSANSYTYRRNGYLHNANLTKENILLFRHLSGSIPSSVLEKWFSIPAKHQRRILDNKKFSQYQLPKNYVPPLAWARRAEDYSFHTVSGHYLCPANRKAALADIRISRLSPPAKAYMELFVNGIPAFLIARRHKKDRSTIRDMVRRSLKALERSGVNRKWLRVLLKK